MPTNKVALAVAGAVAAGALVLGGTALANATTGTSTSSSSSSNVDAGSADTPVTGSEAAKAGAAVTAKDSAVTVTSVRKDPDGSYDVLGTKAGAQVMYNVSADLTTISQASGQGGTAHSGAASTN